MTTPDQLSLLDVTPANETKCGYCLRGLVRRQAGNYDCPRCAPLLAEVGKGVSFYTGVAQWAEFQKSAWKDRLR